MNSHRLLFLVLFLTAAAAGVAVLTAENREAPKAVVPAADVVDPYIDMSPVAPPVRCDDLCRSMVDCANPANDGTQCGTRINPQTGKTEKCFCALCPGGRNCWH